MQRSKNKNTDIIFGSRAIIEAIHADKEIDKVLLQKGLNNDLNKELFDLTISHNIPLVKVPIEKLNRITRKNHQGAICFLSSVIYKSLDHIIDQCYQSGKPPFLIILDRVTDVRNFGAISRSAECGGIDAIVIPEKGSAQINSDAVKTSAGALHHIPVCRTSSLADTIDYLKGSGVQVVACTEKANKPIYDIDLTGPTAFILGSEEDGISGQLLSMCDEKVSLPIQGKIGSLNVSVASAIAIYEGVRQRMG